MGKVLTLDEMRKESLGKKDMGDKPWMDDIEKYDIMLGKLTIEPIHKRINILSLKLTQMEVTLNLAMGDYDRAFIAYVSATHNPAMELSNLKQIIGGMYELIDRLSETFVNTYPAVCNSAIAILDLHKQDNGISMVQCRKIIGRLQRKFYDDIIEAQPPENVEFYNENVEINDKEVSDENPAGVV
jgi:hypothetical protein